MKLLIHSQTSMAALMKVQGQGCMVKHQIKFDNFTIFSILTSIFKVNLVWKCYFAYHICMLWIFFTIPTFKIYQDFPCRLLDILLWRDSRSQLSTWNYLLNMRAPWINWNWLLEFLEIWGISDVIRNCIFKLTWCFLCIFSTATMRSIIAVANLYPFRPLCFCLVFICRHILCLSLSYCLLRWHWLTSGTSWHRHTDGISSRVVISRKLFLFTLLRLKQKG